MRNNAMMNEQERCFCKSHSPSYICPSCHTLFCHNCAKLVGIPAFCICKVCDSLCSDYEKFIQKQVVHVDKTARFGIADFKDALRFPLQEFSGNLGLALVYGALLYSMPYLGFSGVGVFFGILGVVPALLANSFMLGFNLRVINAVGNGRRNFENVLDTSEMLADLGETVALSCAVLFITVAPYLISLLLMPNASLIHWLAFGWMVFYFPLALIVASSTNSFWATINPLNGVGEIQTYKSVYPKFFFYYIFICVIVGGLVFGTLFKLVQSVSGSPIFALLPIFIVVMMILGSLIFYSNLAISYLLGRMRFKESY
jgi:hypothetical protein